MIKTKSILYKINFIWLFILTTPIFLYLILFRNFEQSSKMLLITCAILIYVALALLHHYFDKSLKVEIVIEYVLIGALALMIIQSLLV